MLAIRRSATDPRHHAADMKRGEHVDNVDDRQVEELAESGDGRAQGFFVVARKANASARPTGRDTEPAFTVTRRRLDRRKRDCFLGSLQLSCAPLRVAEE